MLDILQDALLPLHFPKFIHLPMLAIFVLTMTVSLSCTSGSGDPEGVGWRTALESVDSTDTHLFSFSYVDHPPEGTIFHISVLDPGDVAGLEDDEGAACSLFDSTAAKPGDPNFWYLKINLSSTTPGSYTIVPDIDEQAAFQASVRLIHVQNWEEKEATFDAVGGTIELQEAPQDADDWNAGITLRATVDAQFPTHPLRRLGCHSEGPTDGSEIFRECTCEDMEGNQTTCVPEDGQTDCCYAVDGERFDYRLELAADPCGAMCRATDVALFTRYCEALR